MKKLSPKGRWIAVIVTTLLFEVMAVLAIAVEHEKVWNFDSDTVGVAPKGFVAVTGEWTVVEDDTALSKPNVLAQTARNRGSYFNVTIIDQTGHKDIEISVTVKAVAGEEDKGGGLVWRYRDIKNYYIARYNPLEENFRVYKVQDGRRTQFQSANIKLNPGWHTLKVKMEGNHIECSYDGKKYLDVRDDTFKDTGKVGLWTKADAQTYFDDVTVQEGKP
ncbi:MAG: hypothetical protein HY709_02260 [Candidatus Latescibacteria bacterium]|nr:hypothetical protein [Candidatus Latescibacterota bacterium]